MTIRWTLILIMSAWLLASCSRKTTAPVVVKNPTIYNVRGIVERIEPERRQTIIEHEEIPGFMEAMRMSFDVRETKELDGITPGMPVTFQLLVTERESWIEQVRPSSHTAPRAPSAPAAELALGIEWPDFALVNESGRAISRENFAGKAVALTFIFTRCPLPNFCPLMNRNFSAVQSAMERETSTNWRLLSISIDPTHDTPERLAEHAKAFSQNPARWTFATGAPAEVDKLAAAFGLGVVKSGETINHNLRTVIIAPDGKVRRVFEGNEWTPTEVIQSLREAMEK